MFRLFLVGFGVSLFFTSVLLSADYYTLGATGSGVEWIVVDEHSDCHGVQNATANVFFIPTKTSTEWSQFQANPPAGVTILACCAKSC